VPLLHHTAVEVLQADDVLLVELPKRDLEYPHRTLPHRRESMHRLAWDVQLLPGFGVHHLLTELHAGRAISPAGSFLLER